MQCGGESAPATWIETFRDDRVSFLKQENEHDHQ
jgi:hypothetical protein